jgi:IMP cyclohydrolase
MYVGRIVAIGMNKTGSVAAMYRVSSRSFPNRETRTNGSKIAVMPRPGFECDLSKNPYITYNCIRVTQDYAIVTNGSHTDPITEKIQMGFPARDAVILSLLSLDYEKDKYNTPRIAAVINPSQKIALLGIIKKDALLVRNFDLTPGIAMYVATYEHDIPCQHYRDENFDVASAGEAKNYIFNKGIFKVLENPVTSAAVYFSTNGFEVASEV